MDAAPGHRCRELGRRHVFRDVARLEPRHGDRGDAGCLPAPRSRRRRPRCPSCRTSAALADRMDDDAAFRLGGRDRRRTSSRLLRARAASDAVISAMIETAISGGDTAPMARPIGAWMRASAASVTPCRLEPLDAPRMGLLASRARRCRSSPATARGASAGIVDLGIVGERDEGGVAVDAERRQRHVGPFARSP